MSAPARVNALVTELRELVQTDANVHGVRLTLDLAADLPELVVDSGKIQHVILNFVRNSLDAFALRPALDAFALRPAGYRPNQPSGACFYLVVPTQARD